MKNKVINWLLIQYKPFNRLPTSHKYGFDAELLGNCLLGKPGCQTVLAQFRSDCTHV